MEGLSGSSAATLSSAASVWLWASVLNRYYVASGVSIEPDIFLVEYGKRPSLALTWVDDDNEGGRGWLRVGERSVSRRRPSVCGGPGCPWRRSRVRWAWTKGGWRFCSPSGAKTPPKSAADSRCFRRVCSAWPRHRPPGHSARPGPAGDRPARRSRQRWP